MSLCVQCFCLHTHAMPCPVEIRSNFWKSFCHVDPGDWTQVVRLGFDLLSCLLGALYWFLICHTVMLSMFLLLWKWYISFCCCWDSFLLCCSGYPWYIVWAQAYYLRSPTDTRLSDFKCTPRNHWEPQVYLKDCLV